MRENRVSNTKRAPGLITFPKLSTKRSRHIPAICEYAEELTQSYYDAITTTINKLKDPTGTITMTSIQKYCDTVTAVVAVEGTSWVGKTTRITTKEWIILATTSN